MADVYLIAPTAENQKMEGGLNAVLAIGNTIEEARLAVLAAAPNGSFSAAKFAAWQSWEIGATGLPALPNGQSALFLGGAWGANLLAMPGA